MLQLKEKDKSATFTALLLLDDHSFLQYRSTPTKKLPFLNFSFSHLISESALRNCGGEDDFARQPSSQVLQILQSLKPIHDYSGILN